MEIIRREKDIENLYDWIDEGIEEGSHYPGMSYEDGIKATLDWLFGYSNENPMD